MNAERNEILGVFDGFAEHSPPNDLSLPQKKNNEQAGAVKAFWASNQCPTLGQAMITLRFRPTRIKQVSVTSN